MARILFSSEEEITEKLLVHIQVEANALKQNDEFVIENYIDRKVFDPEVQSYLSEEGIENNRLFDIKSLALNKLETNEIQTLTLFGDGFKTLKEKVRKVFCQVAITLKDFDARGAIKTILMALIPAFTTGVPAVVLPIIVGLLAIILKSGIDKICPV